MPYTELARNGVGSSTLHGVDSVRIGQSVLTSVEHDSIRSMFIIACF
jgi:hypothetical protein